MTTDAFQKITSLVEASQRTEMEKFLALPEVHKQQVQVGLVAFFDAVAQKTLDNHSL